MGRRLGHLERDPAQARQDTSAKKQRWSRFSSAVKDENAECFCLWVEAPEARKWKGPKFWDSLQPCETHGKMGAKVGTLQQGSDSRPTPPTTIDLGNSSDEDLSGAGGQAHSPQTFESARKNRHKRAAATVHYHAENSLQPRYTAHTIASDILRAAGVHPTQPPLNWNRDHHLLDIQKMPNVEVPEFSTWRDSWIAPVTVKDLVNYPRAID